MVSIWKDFTTIKSGFTLIELLIVIALLGMLAAGTLALINPLGQIQKAKDIQRKSDLAQIQRALEAYYNDNNTYPPLNWDESWCTQLTTTNEQWKKDVYEALVPTYIKVLPTDPSFANTNKDYFYWKVKNTNSYRLYAVLENTQYPAVQPNILIDDGGSFCSGASSSYNYRVVSP